MTSSTDTVFGLCLPKKVCQPEIWHDLCPGMVVQHIIRFFEHFRILDFEKLYKNSFSFGGQKVFGKFEISI